MKILILLGFLSFAFAKTEEDCSSKGPEYWCKSEATANRCHAVSYCQEYVWPTKKMESPKTDVCTYCQQIVGTLHMMLMQNGSQAQVIAGLKGFCNLLPFTAKTVCLLAVESYGPTIVADIVKYTEDPRKFCKLIELCPSDGKDVVNLLAMMKKLALKKANADYCTPCKGYVKGLLSITSSTRTKSDLVRALKKMCKIFPEEVSNMCPVLLNSHGEQLMDLLFKYMREGQVCVAVGLCRKGSRAKQSNALVNADEYVRFVPEKKSLKAPTKSNNFITCELCTLAMTSLEGMLSDNSTEEEIKIALDKLCAFLPSPIKSPCRAMIEQYAEKILELLIREVPPKFICTEIRLCDPSNKISFNKFSLNKVSLNKAPLKKVSLQKKWKDADKEDNGVSCAICKYVITTVDGMLGNNRTEGYIKKKLDELCDKLPAKLSVECGSLVNQYEHDIIRLLIDEMSPALICQEIHLCPSEGAVAYLAPAAGSFVSNVGGFASNVGSVACEMCKYGVKTMYGALSDKPTQQKIRNALVQLCSHIPTPSVQQECNSLITNDFNEFLNIVLGELKNSTLLCKLAKMCPASADKAVYKVDGSLCETCVAGIKYADTLLKENSTQQMFRAALDKICSALPTSFQAECKAYADKYANCVMNFLLAQLKDPLQLCKELYLCTANQVVAVKEVSLSLNFNFKSPFGCQICEFAIQSVGHMFTKQMQAAIKNDVLEICKRLPASLAGECATLVKQYFNVIMGIIAEKLKDPLECCKEMQICPAAGKKVSGYSLKNGFMCEACKDGVKYLDSFLEKNGTKATIKNDILAVCKSLPLPSLATECVSLVNQYYDVAYNFLLLELSNPPDLCTVLKMCAASNAPTKELSMNTPVLCEACEMGVQYVSTYMKKNETKGEIKRMLITFCSTLGETIGAECVALVGQYYDSIYAMVIQQLADPKTLCTEMHLCSAGSIVNILNPQNFNKFDGSNRVEDFLKMKRMQKSTVSKLASSKNTLTCEICDLTLSELKKMLDSKHDRDMVIKALDHVCTRLPLALKTECTNLVEFYAPQIIAFVVEELKDPAAFCKELKLCTDDLKKLAHSLKNVDYVTQAMSGVGLFDETCQMCMFVTGKLDMQIKKGSPKKKIQRKLKAVCARSRLPAERKEECARMIEEYEDVIMQLVQAVQLPYLCQKIGQCVSTPERHPNAVIPNIEQGLRSRNGGRLCLVCEYAIGALDTLLGAQATKDHIIALVHMVCNKLPNQLFIDECNTLIGQYGDAIIQLFLDQVMAPVEVCTTLNLC